MESGYLKRKLSNGGQVNRDHFAPLEMRAQGEVDGGKLPTGGPYGGYVRGASEPPYYPPAIREILSDDFSDRDKAVLDRMDVITQRDRDEAEYLASRGRIGRLIFKLKYT